MRALWLVLSLALAAPLAAAAEPPPPAEDAELARLKTDFEFGRYRAVLDGAGARIDRGGLADPQLLELHRLAGLSAFNVGAREQAQRHFEALLRLDPDFALDPFSVPPPAIQFFERIRGRLSAELQRIRAERRLQAERQRQEEEERLLRQREAELARQRLEDITRRTIQRVDHHSLMPNFIPFGVGQFEQGRTPWGVAFAISEGVLASASIVAFWVYQESILTTATYTFPGNRPPNQLNVVGVPASSSASAAFWRTLKVSSGIGFYAVYAAGVADALLHYREQTVTTVVQEQPAPPPAPVPLKPRAGLFFAPGGAGVSVSANF